MATKTEIVSGAFTNLGRAPISDISPVTAEPVVITASKKYDLLVENYLGNFPWRFATLIRDLNLLVDKPPIKRFSNAFQLPFDYLNMREVIPNINYRIYEDKLFTNSTEFQIEYTAKVTEDKFPAWFTLFIEYRLTTDLAMPVTQNIKIQQGWKKEAISQLLSAKFQDSQQQPNDVIVRDPIFEAHLGSVGRAG